MFINGMHISPYEQGNIFNRDPLRVRRLLLHKREIMRLYGLVKQQGYALVPLSVYFKGDRVKVQVGLCRGKKHFYPRKCLGDDLRSYAVRVAGMFGEKVTLVTFSTV